MMMIAISWIALLMITTVQGFSTGAPPQACGDLLPNHNAQPSTDPLPYEVDISQFICQSYIPSKLYSITLRTASSSIGRDFKGFMIQARLVADNSPVGSWQTSSVSAKTVCPNNTAATHINKDAKKFITLLWRAPPAGTGAIRFKYTFVDKFSVFWVNLVTQVVQETDEVKCILSTSTKVTDPPTAPSESSTDTPASIMPSVMILPTNSSAVEEEIQISSTEPAESILYFASTQLVYNFTSPSLFSSPSPTPTNPSSPTPSPTTTPTTPPTTVAPVSCEIITGYPVCSPDLCHVHVKTRCSMRVESCPDACQVTTCRACVHTNQSVDWPKECEVEICENLVCVAKWSKCAYQKISSFEMKESDKKPENFKCFVPNCYKAKYRN